MSATCETPTPDALRAIPLGGFRPTSLIDFPGRIAAVLFTQGCSFRCPWCHNAELVLPERFAEPLDPDAVWGRLRARRGMLDGVVLTGGEPRIAKGIHELAAALNAAGKHFTIETAGTVAPEGIACDLASLSPKLANSTPSVEKAGPGWVERHEKTRFQPDVIQEWIQNYDFQLKFVVSGPDDWAEIVGFKDLAFPDVPPQKILLMPEGTDPKTLASRRAWILDLCKQFGFRYCPRLHIDLFGNTRGT